jgi:hypothetical protein
VVLPSSYLAKRAGIDFVTTASKVGERATKLRTKTCQQFMQLCVFPRLRMSPTDAVFSAQFLRLIHGLGTPNFSSLTMYDKVGYHVAMSR